MGCAGRSSAGVGIASGPIGIAEGRCSMDLCLAAAERTLPPAVSGLLRLAPLASAMLLWLLVCRSRAASAAWIGPGAVGAVSPARVGVYVSLAGALGRQAVYVGSGAAGPMLLVAAHCPAPAPELPCCRLLPRLVVSAAAELPRCLLLLRLVAPQCPLLAAAALRPVVAAAVLVRRHLLGRRVPRLPWLLVGIP